MQETTAKDPSATAETTAATPKPLVIEVPAACAHCYFCADSAQPDGKGECRRYPPVATYVTGGLQQGQVVSFFPCVESTSLCGEFVKRQA